MALADFQFSLAGLVFGTGTHIIIEDIAGLGLGSKREKMFVIPGADGAEWGREYRDGPVITFRGQIEHEGDAAGAYATHLLLRAAFGGSGATGGGSRLSPRTTKTLGIKMPGQAEATISGRPDRYDPVMSQLVLGLIPFSATFVAAAPLSV